MYKETDLVALLHDLPEHHLHQGDVGTVAYVYESSPTENGHLYEVEFMNAAGDTLAVVSLREKAIQAVELHNVVLHLREQAA
ncbi:MAG: DUF4926 domain-containing protein [Bacteroidetes bacterium]|nr:DUF4926 domain-containing protein [Bacteroidota bacterium]